MSQVKGYEVRVKIPDGEYCGNCGFVNQWIVDIRLFYSCFRYHKNLMAKGNQYPIKCFECLAHCEKEETK